jgi:oligosaccharide translocation protein RFT1
LKNAKTKHDISVAPETLDAKSNAVFGLFDVNLLKLTYSFLKQSVFKFILTEGEKYVLFYFGTMANQGVYDLVANLGSIIARTVFQSVEEIGMQTWSKELGHVESKEKKAIPTSALLDSGRMLELLLKFCIVLGSIFVFFGPAYTYTLLSLLYGSKWTNTEAPSVLAVYCVYVLFMAVNGVTEAFVHATSEKEQLDRVSNYIMPAFSLGYLAAAYLGLSVFHLGTISLIAANCLNMGLRIVYSIRYIKDYFTTYNKQAKQEEKVNLWKHSIPSIPVCIVFALTFVVTNVSRMVLSTSLMHQGIHVLIGVACLAILAVTMRVTERRFLTDIWQLLRGRRMSHAKAE